MISIINFMVYLFNLWPISYKIFVIDISIIYFNSLSILDLIMIYNGYNTVFYQLYSFHFSISQTN